ncbi:DUF2513 domain-containing protein, partial [Staphylococcus haemolyticus]
MTIRSAIFSFFSMVMPPFKGSNLSMFLIGHLTYQGHEFLNSVADDTVWEETKSKASKLKS